MATSILAQLGATSQASEERTPAELKALENAFRIDIFNVYSRYRSISLRCETYKEFQICTIMTRGPYVAQIFYNGEEIHEMWLDNFREILIKDAQAWVDAIQEGQELAVETRGHFRGQQIKSWLCKENDQYVYHSVAYTADGQEITETFTTANTRREAITATQAVSSALAETPTVEVKVPVTLKIRLQNFLTAVFN